MKDAVGGFAWYLQYTRVQDMFYVCICEAPTRKILALSKKERKMTFRACHLQNFTFNSHDM